MTPSVKILNKQQPRTQQPVAGQKSQSQQPEQVPAAANDGVQKRGGKRTPWTPDDREAWVAHARDSELTSGAKDGYAFSVLPPAGVVEPDDKCSRATEALARLIYEGAEGRYRPLSMGFYSILTDKLRTHHLIGPLYGRRVVAVVKGSNAHALLLPHLALPNSDLDIVVYVDPRCDADMHARLRQAIHTVVVQTLSQHKRAIDHTFFIRRKDEPGQSQPQPPTVLPPELAERFKEDHVRAMEAAGLVSVFSPENPQRLRNLASRNSMVMVQSNKHDGHVAKVEVPHFDACERIPLCRTPVFCSYNVTIGTFNLYRMKFNSLHLAPPVEEEDTPGKAEAEAETEAATATAKPEDAAEDKAAEDEGEAPAQPRGSRRLHRVQADFIDVTIPAQDDADLRQFWERGRFVATWDEHSAVFVLTPDLEWCVKDLFNMLHVHECPETKRAKREQKHELLLTELRRCMPGAMAVAAAEE